MARYSSFGTREIPVIFISTAILQSQFASSIAVQANKYMENIYGSIFIVWQDKNFKSSSFQLQYYDLSSPVPLQFKIISLNHSYH